MSDTNCDTGRLRPWQMTKARAEVRMGGGRNERPSFHSPGADTRALCGALRLSRSTESSTSLAFLIRRRCQEAGDLVVARWSHVSEAPSTSVYILSTVIRFDASVKKSDATTTRSPPGSCL